MKYARIDELRQQHPVAAMCRVLEVSESGYHAWRQRPPSARTQENLRLETEIKAAHQRTRETYGPQRLQSDLADHRITSYNVCYTKLLREGILGLATAFRRRAIAEGVETVAHGETLLRLGCDLGQGYGIARPMAAAFGFAPFSRYV